MFDFDVAMDILEKLTVEERGAVLSALQVMLGPLTMPKFKTVPEAPKYLLYSGEVANLKLDIARRPEKKISGYDEITGIVLQPAVVTVSFECLADKLFGVCIGRHGDEINMTPEERKQHRQYLALDSLTAVRKERELL